MIEDSETGEEQHAGFIQLYSGIVLTVVKGASHMVPQSKRQAGFEIFNSTLSGHADQIRKTAVK